MSNDVLRCSRLLTMVIVFAGALGCGRESGAPYLRCDDIEAQATAHTLSDEERERLAQYFGGFSFGEYFIPAAAEITGAEGVDVEARRVGRVIALRQASASVDDSALSCAAKYASRAFELHRTTLGLSDADLAMTAESVIFVQVVAGHDPGEAGHGYPFGLSVATGFLSDESVVSHEMVHTVEAMAVLGEAAMDPEASPQKRVPQWFREGLALRLANQDGGISDREIARRIQGCGGQSPIENSISGVSSDSCESFSYYPVYRRAIDYLIEGYGMGWVAATLRSQREAPEGDPLSAFPTSLDAATESGVHQSLVNGAAFAD